MNYDLQKQHEEMGAYDMIEHLKQLYQGYARHEKFDVSKPSFNAKWHKVHQWEHMSSK